MTPSGRRTLGRVIEMEHNALQVEVRAWLREHWNPDIALAEWRELLADSGWGCPTWPTDYFGRGLSTDDARLVEHEFVEAGAVGVAGGSAMSLAAPTLLAHGSHDVKQRLLRGALTGAHKWCQLFSEPGSGSDLAGLTTKAERDGDEWVVSGQKVWTTGAQHAAYAMLLARTDWNVAKHRGITWFAFPMDQPGVEVRPLRQMNRYTSFNEVFINEARVPHANVVGAVNDGWAGALTTLSFERGLTTLRMARVPAGGGRCIREAREEAESYAKVYEWYPQRAGRADLVLSQARAAGLTNDVVLRDAMMSAHAFERTARWNVDRAVAARQSGRSPGPEGSLAKLTGSTIARQSHALHARIAGAHAMLANSDSPLNGIIHEILVSVPGASIAGGTDEIQHNIVGEQSLGLPREPSTDAHLAFRDVPRNTGRG